PPLRLYILRLTRSDDIYCSSFIPCRSLSNDLSFFFTLLPPPRSTLFPYTTLFRSALCKTSPKEMDASAGGRYAPLLWVGVPSTRDRKSTRLNSSHEWISYAVFCLKKKKNKKIEKRQRGNQQADD